MDSGPDRAAAVILVCGHESAYGADLADLPAALPGGIVTPAGRPLQDALSASPARSDDPLVVVPMTFGRDPALVAEAARTLAWQGRSGQRFALAGPFGQADHLIAWLRTAANRIQAEDPSAAILISVAAANPFDDAELFRIGHLVRTHGVGNTIDVCIDDDQGDALARGVTRLERLGFDRVVVVPAGFQRVARAPFGAGRLAAARFYGPLMTVQSMLRLITERRRDALHRLAHDDNGVAAGLQADHGHGYAHSHAFDGSSTHAHQHGGGHPYTHGNFVHTD